MGACAHVGLRMCVCVRVHVWGYACVCVCVCTCGHVCAGSLTDQHLGRLLPDGSRVLGQSCADVFQRRWTCDVLGVPGGDRGLQKVGRKGEVWSAEGGGCRLMVVCRSVQWGHSYHPPFPRGSAFLALPGSVS